jgi:putative ABC transport system ATP-binding protein
MTFAGMHSDASTEKGLQLLDLVGLGSRHQHKPLELSGGQQQRVAIARSFANDPAIILADEPTGNLDQRTGEEAIELLRSLCRERGVTIITATHDYKMINVSDRVVWVKDGRVDKEEYRDELNISLGTIGEKERE